VRVDIRRIGSLKEGEGEVLGNRVKAKVVKNKVAPPFRSAEFDMMFDQGISREADILDLGVEHKIVVKTGSWLSYGNTRLGQGKENSRRLLIENPALAEEIEKKIMEVAAPKFE